MFVVTNRQVTKRQGLGQFGRKPNEKGPHEIRLFEVKRTTGQWDVELLDDQLHGNTVRSLITKHQLSIDPADDWFASLRVACEIAETARRQCKHIVVFVHGYNNDMADVLGMSQRIAETHDVIVVPFSWPANGGGAVSGTLSYKNDKRDARASVGALDRLFMKAMEYLLMLTEGQRLRLFKKATRKHPQNPAKRDAYYAEMLAEQCPSTVNLLCHSMGAYLYKLLLKSTASEARRLLFDNVVLAAADVNNFEHATWLDRIRSRGRVFVTINENDFALSASRAKAGEEQLSRLGHVTYALNSSKGRYVDLTGAKGIGNAHTYFVGTPVNENAAVKDFFTRALQGDVAEAKLRFDQADNVYRLP